MSERSRDQQLGMNRSITRRDFLNGVSVAVGGSILASNVGWMAALDDGERYAPEKDPNYYPPALMGMRGNHDGTYTYAHQVRDGNFWDDAGKPESTGEVYDLVAWGAGSAVSLPHTSSVSKQAQRRASWSSITMMISGDMRSATSSW